MSGWCPNCMEPLGAGPECPHCGKAQLAPQPPGCLPAGTVLANGRYLVGRALGQGGFGITYIGRDLTLNMRIAIKEYFPISYATRQGEPAPGAPAHGANVVVALGTKAQTRIEAGRRRFLDEARVLAKFHDSPGIVDVRDFFEENATAYIVMDYLEGETLKSHLQHATMSADEAFALMQPIFDTLELVHADHVIHRDISPDNIMLRSNGSLCLMDFGAAQEMDFNDQRSVSMVLKSGYAPEEQYRAKGELGPWTDIYALCATMYRAITGVSPDESLQRLIGDEMVWPSEMGIDISPVQERALKKGMAPRSADRYHSIAEMKADLALEGYGAAGGGPSGNSSSMSNGAVARTDDLRSKQADRQQNLPSSVTSGTAPTAGLFKTDINTQAPPEAPPFAPEPGNSTMESIHAGLTERAIPIKRGTSSSGGGSPVNDLPSPSPSQDDEANCFTDGKSAEAVGNAENGPVAEEHQQRQGQQKRKGGKPIAAAAVACALAAVTALFLFMPAFTVSFDVAGGSPVEAIATSRLGTLEEPQAPTREDYEFAGWYLDEACTDQAEFPLRVSSDTTLHAAWNKTRASYRVDYLDATDNSPVANAKTVEDAEVGSKVTEKAPEIEGYALDSDRKAKLVVSEDDSANVMSFRYRKLVSYVVNYRNKAGDYDVAPAKTVDGVAEGSEVSETAPEIAGYTLQSDREQAITLKRNSKKNAIVFYYEPIPVATPSNSGGGGGSSSKSSGNNDVKWAN